MSQNLKYAEQKLSENPFMDNDFVIDAEGKTFQFNNQNSEKISYDIHHYGDGGKIYFKNENTRKNNRFSVV
ncbi:MAG: hypothetical protein ACI825_001249 [Planctomycetota bacterium]|jgi:hypothetical protein|uniref:hypothetical protein n=1 Tax=Patiriisocius sp. Uisw_047 TaxID=3230969 RepID=UPI0039E9193D